MSIHFGARSYLFAPGNNVKLLDRVFTAGADAVVLDLEDAVPPDEKDNARTLVREAVAARSETDAAPAAAETPRPELFIRVNGLDSGRTRDDIAATVQRGVHGIRLPKAERADEVRQVSAWIAEAERQHGLPAGAVRLDCTIESARGVMRAEEIAGADPRVGALVFGHADYLADTGAEPAGGEETLVACSLLVLASRSAGIAPPIDGAYTRLRDEAGLRAATELARRRGFFGKSAIHPEQLSVIHAVFAPSEAAVEQARAIVAAYEQAQADGSGAVRLADGQFVDRPIALRAYQVLAQAGQSAATN